MRKHRRTNLHIALVSALAALATQATAGQITLFERPEFQGRSMTTGETITDLQRSPFNEVASSIIVGDGTWEACTERYFRGRCAQLAPGSYGKLSRALRDSVASMREIGDSPIPGRIVLSPDPAARVAIAAPVTSAPVVTPVIGATVVSTPMATAPVVTAPVVPVVTAPVTTASLVTTTAIVPATSIISAVAVPAGPRVILYQRGTDGLRAVELTTSLDDLSTRNFNDRAESAFVSGGVWRLCEDANGRGRCADFGPGQYVSLGTLDRRVSSAYLVAPVYESATTLTTVPAGRAVLYQFPNYGSPSAVVEYGRAPDINWANFRGPAASLRIESGSWLVCSEMGYQGECRVLEPGDYPSIASILSHGIASARQVWRPELGSLAAPQDGSLNLYRMQ